MPPPISSRAKLAAALTGHLPESRGTGSRARLSATLTDNPFRPGPARQDATSPERVLGGRAKLLANRLLHAPSPVGRQPPLLPATVVTLPNGQLAVYTPKVAPLDPAGTFTRHLVWLPPTAGAPPSRNQAVIRQGRPWPQPAPEVDWSRLWQRLLAGLPRLKRGDGFIYYSKDRHATGSVPTHARDGRAVAVYDITWLLRTMDVTTAEWKRPGQYSFEWARQVAWVMRLFNNVTAAQDMRGKVGLDALDEDMKGGADEAYKRLRQQGWVPRWLDSTAVARLQVRAIVPKQVTYSGRKTSKAQIDSLYQSASAKGTVNSGGGYGLDDATGDSTYTKVDYDQNATEIHRVTVKPGANSRNK